MIPRFKPWLGWPEFAALFRRNRGVVQRFETEFAQAFKAVDAVAFPYGRSAQWAFFKAMGIENAEIIMPAYTCSVVAHAVTLSGNTPRFIDIDLYDYNMNLDEAKAAITENTRAIIATHTFGYPQDLDRLEAMVTRAEAKYGHKIWLMQDCCHAFGAEWKGRVIGTLGDVAVYAFNISKIMTSIFGGMLTFQDQALADQVRAWRDGHYHQAHWLKAIQRRLYLLAVYIAFSEKVYGLTWWLQEKTPLLNRLIKAYHLDDQIHFPPDYLDHMLDVEAAVGLAQLRKYRQIVQRRRESALWYDQHLERREGWHFPPIIDGATYSHYVVRVPERDRSIDEFARKRIHLGALIQYSIPELPPYKKLSVACPISLHASQHTVNFSVSASIPDILSQSGLRYAKDFEKHWRKADYSLPSKQKLHVAEQFLKPIIAKINTADDRLKILDAGCGDGVHALSMSKLPPGNHKFSYLGVDISKIAIATCKDRLHGDKRFVFQVGDISKKDLGTEFYDVIFSYGVIAYTDEPLQTIRNLANALKPDGIFVSWVYTPTIIQRYALQTLRFFSRLVGEQGTDKLASLIVFLMEYLPVSSGVNLKNSNFLQCKESVLVNIAPTKLWLPTVGEVNKRFLEAGLALDPNQSNANVSVYRKK